MDERYEHLCEIGQVLMDADRKEVLKVYIDLMLEHYPVELLEVFGDRSDSDSDYEPEVSASEVSASEVSASEVSASEVSASEVSASEVSASEVSASDNLPSGQSNAGGETVVLELQGGEEARPDSSCSEEEESDSGSEDERAMAELLTVQKDGGFYSLA